MRWPSKVSKPACGRGSIRIIRKASSRGQSLSELWRGFPKFNLTNMAIAIRRLQRRKHAHAVGGYTLEFRSFFRFPSNAEQLNSGNGRGRFHRLELYFAMACQRERCSR